MTARSSIPEFTVPICPVCHNPKWQKHLETCPGPRQRIAPPPEHEPGCECPAGAWHQRDCPIAAWPEDAA